MLGVLVVLATFYGCNALELADCSKTKAIEKLDLKSLEGKWYELMSYGTIFSHGMDRCMVTNIKAGDDGKSFVMSMDRIAELVNTHMKTSWTVNTAEENPTGDLMLSFKMPLIGAMSVPLKILGTDNYQNYVIFNACYSVLNIFKFNLGFILTKQRHYSATELQSLYSSIDKDLEKNGLSRRQFYLSKQEKCEEKSTTPTDAASAGSGVSGADKSAAADAGTKEEKTKKTDNDKTDTEKTATSEAKVTQAEDSEVKPPTGADPKAKTEVTTTEVKTSAVKAPESETPKPEDPPLV